MSTKGQQFISKVQYPCGYCELTKALIMDRLRRYDKPLSIKDNHDLGRDVSHMEIRP